MYIRGGLGEKEIRIGKGKASSPVLNFTCRWCLQLNDAHGPSMTCRELVF